MAHLLIRHKVADFAKWKTAYDAHATTRTGAGLKEERLWRNQENANEVFILFTAADVNKARAFSSSPDLAAVMRTAGVVDKPAVYFLQ